jgi:hypothetical protein
MEEKNESVRVLEECINLQVSKGRDYQNPNSRVKQAMYYPRGLDSIMDIIHAKYLRIISLTEAQQDPKFESIEDSLKDGINYMSFAAAYMRGEIDGQDPNKDIFNKEITPDTPVNHIPLKFRT